MADTRLVVGDITTAEVDAIVNAANERMLGGGGVDGAIHRAAGPDLLAECRKVPAVNGIRCPTGEARITGAGNLPARYVIHTVGPVYHQVSHPAALLASAYRNSLQLALDNACRSIAFPAISCGVFGYPLEAAAKVALETCAARDYESLNIVFYLFDETTYSAWHRSLSTR
ncbi:O-acetyl-ADP-ribose deacetylase [Seongchinamella unica]|uniref:O-acetyl-ADP-ribose deacetylase n=1 Tax=Seongchinamella unica TaxID=2547392 RepID=A0A4R5LPW7_9GAMM|nr:O-acetyl-ADP-ribose deacetylase [Seongchinamella unica]TDG12578.1 O-acetyl-ADP-ribose deacetylase [Seongchinamella unica]